MQYFVHEIFKSIQGESSFAGLLCTFVRFAGCNLRCSYCDTQEAQNSLLAHRFTADQIIEHIVGLTCPLILLTGGEPLLQKNLEKLCDELGSRGYTVCIETNGTISIEPFSTAVRFIMDVKCPSSGAAHSFYMNNLDYIKPADELKFVLSDRDDYRWATDFISENKLNGRCQLIFSPVWNAIVPHELASWMIEDNLTGVRLQLQLHKLIWGPEAKGV